MLDRVLVGITFRITLQILTHMIIFPENTSCTTRWDAIASCLPGRTSRDVRKRWINVLENQFNKGAWTKSEDDRLRIAVQLHGTRWVNVAKDVGTRSADRTFLVSVEESTD
jgi:hypothetical protein